MHVFHWQTTQFAAFGAHTQDRWEIPYDGDLWPRMSGTSRVQGACGLSAERALASGPGALAA